SSRSETRDMERLAGLATVVLAAGAGTRFGGPKQLAELEGRPLLARVLESVEGFGEDQVVVLGAAAEQVRVAVPEDRWKVVVVTDWEAGLGASLRAGLASVPDARSALVVLGDLPWLRREAVERVLAAAEDSDAEAVRAFEGTVPGHPVFLRGSLLERARSAPDAGLAGVLKGAHLTRVECAGLGACRDVDVRADLDQSLRPR
ncbi:MAG TPA: nucleotidyltransferase family protein, partial [Solirubrobacterales bacterium]|nr:nucleotidyltransferase family protein [Solirubrobacterales bacterium]